MDNDSQTELEGQLERITYFSEETGFTVARLRVQGSSEPVTVVCNLIAPTPGEILMLNFLRLLGDSEEKPGTIVFIKNTFEAMFSLLL